jgi:hypothetical protein
MAVDEHRFDDFTRFLGTGHSRRVVLRVLAGGALAGALTRLRGGGGAKPPDGTCQPKPGGKCSDAIPCCNGFCDTGQCPCATGKTLCHGQCVTTSTFDSDLQNCGACGNACPQGLACRNGQCVGDSQGDCDEGLVMCGGFCTKLDWDTSNCGECNHICWASDGSHLEPCVYGQCGCQETGGSCEQDWHCCHGRCVEGACRDCVPPGSACRTDCDCCGRDGSGRCVEGTCHCCQYGNTSGGWDGTTCLDPPADATCCDYPLNINVCEDADGHVTVTCTDDPYVHCPSGSSGHGWLANPSACRE